MKVLVPSLSHAEKRLGLFFLKLIRGNQRLLQRGGPKAESAFSAINEEMAIIRPVLDHAIRPDAPVSEFTTIAIEIVTNLYFYWYSTSSTAEGKRYLTNLIDPVLSQYKKSKRLPPHISRSLMAQACNVAGHLTYWQGDRWKMSARAYWNQALKFCSAAPSEEKGRTLIGLSYVNCDSGRYKLGIKRAEQALEIFTALQDDLLIADGLCGLGWAIVWSEDAVRAVEHFRQAAAIYRKHGETAGLLEALNGLIVETSILMESECLAYFDEAFALAGEFQDRATVSSLMHNFAWYLIDLEGADAQATLHNLHEAKRLFAASWREALDVDYKHGVGYGLEGPACVAYKEGALLPGSVEKELKWKRSLHLFAAAQAHRIKIGETSTPTDKAYYAPMLKEMKNFFHRRRPNFKEIWEEGKTLAADDCRLAIKSITDEIDEIGLGHKRIN